MNTKKNLVLLAQAIVGFLYGATAQYLEPGIAVSRTGIWFTFLGATLLFAWYYFDSEQIQYQRGRLLNIGIIFLAIIALPYYFFRSRGLKKGFVYTALFLMMAFAWSALQEMGAYAVYYVIQS